MYQYFQRITISSCALEKNNSFVVHISLIHSNLKRQWVSYVIDVFGDNPRLVNGKCQDSSTVKSCTNSAKVN